MVEITTKQVIREPEVPGAIDTKLSDTLLKDGSFTSNTVAVGTTEVPSRSSTRGNLNFDIARGAPGSPTQE